MTAVDVEEIMSSIRDDIQKNNKRYVSKEKRKGVSFDGDKLEKALSHMADSSINEVFGENRGNPLKKIYQRVIQKLFGFLVFNPFKKQNDFNRHTLEAVSQLRLSELDNGYNRDEKIKELEARIEVLEEKIKELSKKE
ncbi:MAG: hypothetical protein K6F84_04720 [Lachnospiraceae bacterium]|nr:hypothetical protein [Lachnospiraceae bacterium]